LPRHRGADPCLAPGQLDPGFRPAAAFSIDREKTLVTAKTSRPEPLATHITLESPWSPIYSSTWHYFLPSIFAHPEHLILYPKVTFQVSHLQEACDPKKRQSPVIYRSKKDNFTKATKYTVEKIIRILQGVESGKAVASVCRHYNMVEAVVHRRHEVPGDLGNWRPSTAVWERLWSTGQIQRAMPSELNSALVRPCHDSGQPTCCDYHPFFMASGRIQRNIERILDEVDNAVSCRDWIPGWDHGKDVLALDPQTMKPSHFWPL